MSWEHESFYEKSKLYVRQADKLASEDRFYIFWHILAFEFLVKSCLAKKSKALLAEAKGYHSILYSVDVEVTVTPKQRPVNELLEILRIIVPVFTDEDAKKALKWANHRNEELHTASDKLSSLAETNWISDYYKLSKKLLFYLDKPIEDFFGKQKAPLIEKALVDLQKDVAGEAKKEINHSISYFSRLSDVEKNNIRLTFKRPHKAKVAECPSCKEKYAVIYGEKIHTSEAQLEDDDLYTISKYLPSSLDCHLCRLKLKGFSLISAAGLGAEFSIKEFIDPVEQFNIDIDEEYNSLHPDEDDERGYEDEYMDE